MADFGFIRWPKIAYSLGMLGQGVEMLLVDWYCFAIDLGTGVEESWIGDFHSGIIAELPWPSGPVDLEEVVVNLGRECLFVDIEAELSRECEEIAFPLVGGWLLRSLFDAHHVCATTRLELATSIVEASVVVRKRSYGVKE